MSNHQREFVARSRLAVPAPAVYAWYGRSGAFERLVPPWAPAKVVAQTGGIQDGGRVTLRLKVGAIPLHWELEHFGYRAGSQFGDRQLRGPFGHWEHIHRVEPDGSRAAWLEDRISYSLPAGALGELVGPGLVRDRLAETFAFRHRQMARDLLRQQAHHAAPRLSVAISGASGLIGRALGAFLETDGHRVLRLVRSGSQRRPSAAGEIPWDPEGGRLDPAHLEGLDAVIHLAGESVAAGRWTAERKRRIKESRTKGTSLLARALAASARPPRLLVSASGVNIYGAHGAEAVDEGTPAGAGFLADVVTAWEAAAAPAAERGIRVVHPRFGAVLDPGGGALARFLPPFRAGVGGPLGSGRQMMSWVALDDVIGAIYHALHDDQLHGPFNVTAPESVTNAVFARTLGRVLGRPAALPVPTFALRALFGQMAEEMILTGARVLPTRLTAAGFRFEHPQLHPALAEMLGKTAHPTIRSDGKRDELVLATAGIAAA
jgi:uncharacterized protein (TIGR01777 family)